MQIVTLSPVYTPFNLKAGIDPPSALYMKALEAVPPEREGALFVPNRAHGEVRDGYEDLSRDGYDMRFLVWERHEPENGISVRFHVYPNEMSIAQVTIDYDGPLDAAHVEVLSQTLSRDMITRHSAELFKFLRDICSGISSKYLDTVRKASVIEPEDISWVPRALVLSEEERGRSDIEPFLTRWLENTARPEDAKKIIDGETDYSLTWLNYVIVEGATKDGAERRRMLLSAMRIAQFFYAAQERLNEKGQRAITNALFMKNVRKVERMLVEAQANMRMLRIQYDIQKSYLNRNKRKVMDSIMEVWDYETLMENGDRIMKFSTAKLKEITTKRAERSSFITDMILVSIALITVVEVSLYFVEYSREVMSRPVLEYQDSRPSFILRFIASIEIDTMLLLGTSSVLTLVLLYAFWKVRK